MRRFWLIRLSVFRCLRSVRFYPLWAALVRDSRYYIHIDMCVHVNICVCKCTYTTRQHDAVRELTLVMKPEMNLMLYGWMVCNEMNQRRSELSASEWMQCMLSKRLSHSLPPNSRLSERCVHVPHMSGPCVRRRNARTLCDFVLDVRRGDARMIAVLIAQIILSHAITSRCVCVCVQTPRCSHR